MDLIFYLFPLFLVLLSIYISSTQMKPIFRMNRLYSIILFCVAFIPAFNIIAWLFIMAMFISKPLADKKDPWNKETWFYKNLIAR